VSAAPAMAETVSLWCVRIAVPAAAGAFAEALEPFCQSVSWSADSDGGEAAVEGICQERPRRAVLARALDGVAAALGTKAPALRFGRLQSRDWLAESVHAFPPIEAGRYYIHGSHEMAPLGAKPRLGLGEDRPAPSLAIVMDAGAAFGTGEHPSTRGCLVALDALARRRRFRVPLDMGCGAGLLAIAMAKTWRRPVVACDIDPVAVRVARANAERNGVGGRVRAGQGDGYGAPCVRRGAPYDLVVANILARPLRRMAPALAGVLARPGAAVLSGFLEGAGAGVLAAHRRRGLRAWRRITIDGWQTLVLRS